MDADEDTASAPRDPGGGNSPYWVATSAETRAEARHWSPSAARNKAPILEVLARHLPGQGRILEIASGTGQHAAAFAAAHPALDWYPSDAHAAARESIAAWVAESGLPNLHPPRALDASDPAWPDTVPAPLAAIVAINLVHISPWAATLGLLSGAARALGPDGRLILYSCFRREGRHVSESNADFDASLVARDPGWGVRDVAVLRAAAPPRGLRMIETVAMPANNTMAILGPLPGG